ncbi:hypothetical protein [uncultured Sphingomonas sp.]|uniref:hypothetical protein n=1 Tax=uncultured Sphingomonas sp. TaxID=158754 RepID=UPI0025E22E0D|nr:hypothetical protein [uncultured Sphingomonas sp.]
MKASFGSTSRSAQSKARASEPHRHRFDWAKPFNDGSTAARSHLTIHVVGRLPVGAVLAGEAKTSAAAPLWIPAITVPPSARAGFNAAVSLM